MTQQVIREMTLVRTFDAPRELVFNAWTDEQLLAKWWGPHGFTTPVSELDSRPGGKIHVVMEDAAGLIRKGSRYPMTGTFEEIDAPKRLVYTSSAIMDGKPIIESHNTVTFEVVDGKTKVTLYVAVTKAAPEAEAPLAGMEIGWSQSLEKLADLVRTEAR